MVAEKVATPRMVDLYTLYFNILSQIIQPSQPSHPSIAFRPPVWLADLPEGVRFFLISYVDLFGTQRYGGTH